MALSSLALAAPLLLGAASPAARLEVRIDGLRSQSGQLRLCLLRAGDPFPDCRGNARAPRLIAPAAAAGALVFEGVAPGDYALAVIHDENGNGRLDKLAGIPREGFGFSRNPRIRFGPPRFDDARFHVDAGAERQRVALRYIL